MAAAGADEARARARAAYFQPTSHPVESIQKDWLRNQLESKHHIMGNVYGSHLPMRVRMEMSIVSQVQRLPGLPSHNVGLETLLGRDETIDFEDYLGAPEFSEHEVDTRAVLERKFGLQAPTSLMGPPTGLSQRVQSLSPREGVAMRKDVC